MRVVRWLSTVAILLIGMSLTVDFVMQVTGHDRILGLRPLFDVDAEGNIPTFFSGALLLACAALLGTVGAVARRAGSGEHLWWKLLAAVFVFLAVDEASLIHELLIGPVRGLTGELPAVFRYAWVLPYGAAVIVGSLLGLRFFLRLPRPTQRRFLLAAALYLGGAIGFEMIGGAYVAGQTAFQRTSAYILIFTVEELLEMAGLIMFLNALMRHLEEVYPDHALRWTSGPDAAASVPRAASTR